MATFAYLFVLGSFNPTNASVGDANLRRQRDSQANQASEGSLFDRTKSSISARHSERVRELGRELPMTIEQPTTAPFALSTLGNKISLGNLGEMNGPLNMEAPIVQENFLERMYLERPYANSGPAFDRSMRYEFDHDSPFRHETQYDYDRIRTSQNDQLKGWSKHAMREQARDFVGDADQDSAPIRALHMVKGVFGGGDLFHKDEKEANDSRRKRRRNDVSISSEEHARSVREAEVARVYLDSHDRSVRDDDDIETKLRSRLNVARRMGKVELQNPIMTTGAQVDLRARDKIEVKARRELKALALDTSLSYGLRHKTVAMNVEKKITDEISCELRSTKSNHTEILRDQSVRLNYKIDF